MDSKAFFFVAQMEATKQNPIQCFFNDIMTWPKYPDVHLSMDLQKPSEQEIQIYFGFQPKLTTAEAISNLKSAPPSRTSEATCRWCRIDVSWWPPPPTRVLRVVSRRCRSGFLLFPTCMLKKDKSHCILVALWVIKVLVYIHTNIDGVSSICSVCRLSTGRFLRGNEQQGVLTFLDPSYSRIPLHFLRRTSEEVGGSIQTPWKPLLLECVMKVRFK